ncbi:hypothetical protein C8R45DRAFT_1163903 [Mycena sanguinolenta]|nr:hypothetical protein C8R45DRAFT_1163903 [Mycena sanguinolenta]
MASPAAQLEQLYQTIGDFYTANLNGVAALSWLAYDIIITLDQEVNQMWRAKFSAPSFIYFTSRYYGLVYMIWAASVSTNFRLPEPVIELFIVRCRSNLQANDCKGWGPLEAASVQFLSMGVNALLAIRIDAFYNRNMKVRAFLVFIYLGEFVTEVVFSTLTGVDSADARAHPPGLPIPGCVSSSTPRFGLAAWVTNIVYQALCFTLALYKFFSVFRGEVTGSRLAMMMFGANMVNIILNFGVPESPLLQICVPWLIATFSVGAPRIILNLKTAANSKTYTSEFEMHVRTHGETLVFGSGNGQHNETLDIAIESSS